MEKEQQLRVEIAELFDLYGELLTQKQQDVLKVYYFLDFSLSEIADNLSISRQGVHAGLTSGVKALYDFESKVKMRSRLAGIKSALNKIIAEEESFGGIKRRVKAAVEEHL